VRDKLAANFLLAHLRSIPQTTFAQENMSDFVAHFFLVAP
jgi:hypothetical protein